MTKPVKLQGCHFSVSSFVLPFSESTLEVRLKLGLVFCLFETVCCHVKFVEHTFHALCCHDKFVMLNLLEVGRSHNFKMFEKTIQ